MNETEMKRLDEVWEMVQNCDNTQDVRNVAALYKEVSDSAIKRQQEEMNYLLEERKVALEEERIKLEKANLEETKINNKNTIYLKVAEISVKAVVLFATYQLTKFGAKVSYLAANEGIVDQTIVNKTVDSAKRFVEKA